MMQRSRSLTWKAALTGLDTMERRSGVTKPEAAERRPWGRGEFRDG
jgi:hypothetical protein